ncbi:type VII secretion protein EccB [Actinomadura hibisca]|uniref:type VII secretion protein EccB n=1 Tax=Actinomadura hibisca TaxID=68565 RepID=UPI0008320E92|nr:type VII secretion protein EccB [Actinomadura hibisca]
MQTRKDLYQAHRLMTQRVALALLQGRPGAAESPLRRTGVGALCGVMVVVLIAAGFGVTGLIFKGGARGLEKPGLLIIEKETGATYAFSARDRRLVPFVNYASARLAMPETTMTRKMVSSRSLAKYTRGPLSGIPGAPESLPEPGRLTKSPWSVCVRRSGGTTGDSTVSLIGGRDVGGRPLRDDQAVLVQAAEQTWLVWRNKRMRISPQGARMLAPSPPTPIDPRWLNGLPQGPDFAAPDVPKRGTRTTGPDNAEAKVGQVFHVAAIAGTADRWYVQLADGLAAISETQARLLLEAADGPGPQRDITPGQAGARPSPTSLYSRDLPESPPRPAPFSPEEPLCAVYRDTGKLSADARFTIGGNLPGGPATGAGGGLDEVFIPGGGTFVGTLTGSGQAPSTFALITEQGMRYPVPTTADVEKLGYSVSKAAPVPAGLLQLFREGPPLSSAAAARPVPTS